MTVSASVSKASYSGNGSTTVFAVPFYFLENTHIKVTLRSAAGVETVQVLTTDYTVTGAGAPLGGSITMTTAPAAGTTLYIARNAPLTQETDYQANDPFPAETHERALDKLTMIVQQIQEQVDRSVKVTITDPTDPAVLIADLKASAASAATNATAAGNSATAAAASATLAQTALTNTQSAISTAGVVITSTSTTSLAIGTGSKSFTTQTGKAWVPGHNIRIVSNANPTVNFMTGQVTSYNSGTGALVVNVDTIGGSGTLADWTMSLYVSTTPGANSITSAMLQAGVAAANLGFTPANPGAVQSFTKAQRGSVVALTDGVTITPDFSLANNFSVTLAGNRTLANPTNLVAGQSGVIAITQDATGARTLAYGSNYKFAAGAAPTLTTTANAIDLIAYYVETTSRISCRFIGDVK